MYAFVPNKLFGQLLDISPNNFIFPKKFSLEFSYIEAWFTDQNLLKVYWPQNIKDKINTTLKYKIKVY